MHEKVSDATILTVVISTILLLFLAILIILFLFAYQKKSYRHQQEVAHLEKAFQNTLLLSRLEMQEHTLDHIAKELHANISHILSVININLAAYLHGAGDTAHANVRESKVLVKQVMAEVKNLSVVSNTEHAKKAGFVAILITEAERLRKTGQYEVSLSITGERYRLQPEKEIILTRLCQEVLNNAVRHAQASRIDLTLAFTPTYVQVSISDNGIGFDLAGAERQAGITGSTGLTNIYSRSKQIDGDIQIHSKVGAGTRVDARIPT